MKRVILASLVIFKLTAAESSLYIDMKNNELLIDSKKGYQLKTKSTSLLEALIKNSDNIQLKDGTIINIRDLTNNGDKVSVDQIKKNLDQSKSYFGGEGTGTGGGGKFLKPMD